MHSDRFARRHGIKLCLLPGLALVAALVIPRLAYGQGDATEADTTSVELNVQLYGFVLSQLILDANRTFRDPHLNIQPLPGIPGVPDQEPDAFFDVRPTRVGLDLSADLRENLTGAGKLEIDFDTPTGRPRIRHAYVQLRSHGWRVLGGQTWPVVSQLNPTTINNDNLFNLGNTYERIPQGRVTYRNAGGKGPFELQLAAVSFFGAFDQILLALQTDPAVPELYVIESNTPPSLQGRLAYGWRNDMGLGHLALGSSVGRVDTRSASGAEASVTHFLVVAEALIPATDVLIITAEAFYGSAPGFNGGIGQTAVVTAQREVVPVKSWGGFAQVAFVANDRFGVNLVGGLDDPESRPGGTPLVLGRNWTLLANAFWRVAGPFNSGLEVQYIKSEYEAASTSADNLRTTLALFVNF